MAAATTESEFVQILAEMGYTLKTCGKSGVELKFPAIKPPGGKEYFRLHKLGEGYTLEEIRARILANIERKPPFVTVQVKPMVTLKANGLAVVYAILRQQQKTQGKTRLVNMLKSGRELKVFAVRDEEIKTFCRAAKNYGVLYCVLKDRDATDGITDIMVRAEDAAKINRIFERFHLAEVKVQNESEKAKESQDKQDKLEQFLDELLKPREEKAHPEVARRESDSPSEPTSERKGTGETFIEEKSIENTRPSVRQAIREIREIQKKRQERSLPQNGLERINKVLNKAKER